MKTVIDVKHLSKQYGTKSNQVRVLDNLSFSIDEGEFVGIMGPSGAGKTTLMNILSTINLPTLGSVRVAGEDITQLTESQLSDFRRKKLGFIFQDFNLLDTLDVRDNIYLPMAVDRLPLTEMEKQATEVCQLLGIGHLLDRYPDELSTGQKQRVAAARALVRTPQIIFADEPTGALDSKAAAELLNYLSDINLAFNTTILMVTHDPYTASYCNRILFIKDGMIFSEIIRKASRQEFFEQVIDMQATIGGGGKWNAL